MIIFQQVSRYLAGLIAGLSLLGCDGQQLSQPGHQLQIGASLWPGYEPLYLARNLNYWDTDQIRLIEYPSSTESLRAFRNGSIDAAVTFEPMRTRLSNLGAREIFPSRDIPGEIVDVLVARKSYVDENPEQIQALVDGWFRALGFLQQHPQQSYSIMSDRLNLTIEEVAAMYDGITIPDRTENMRLLRNSGQQLREAVTTLNQIMVDHQLIASMVDFQNLALDTFVKLDPASGPRSDP